MFEAWLRQLDEELRLGGQLVLDEDQRCFLMFAETLLVEIRYNPPVQTFRFQCVLDNGNVPQRAFYNALLDANFGWKNTNGAVFGLQFYDEKTQLVQNFPIASCDYTLFNRSLERFVNTFEYWLHHIETLKPAEPCKKTTGLLV